MNPRIRRLCSLASLALAGCAFVQLHEETKQFDDATILAGRVTAPADWRGPILVAAVTGTGASVSIAHEVRLHEPGGYELIVPDGSYSLIAFGDANGNGYPDGDEPAGVLSSPVNVANTTLISMLDFSIEPGHSKSVRDKLPKDLPPPPTLSSQIGAIADLDAPEFSAQSGRDGYWTPYESFRARSGNVYFLEPYDPKRIPVLFVHGAAGSAQDFRYLLQNIDRDRFQVWLFQYPSGIALESMANLLYWKLVNLQVRYRYDRLHIVAHSMGGLVVRRFLIDHGEQFPQLGQFISISTPWGGETSATAGVNHAPAVIPSWRDMQPDGPFLASLFQRPLPSQVTHTLLFGHRGGYNLLRPTSDGTITLASQLRPEAQAGARLVMGFDEDHVSILSSSAVLAQLERTLAPQGPGSDSAQLRVTADLGGDRYHLSGMPTIVLRPPQGAPLVYPLHPGEQPHVVSPVPPGEYEVAIAAGGFQRGDAWPRVSLSGGDVTDVQVRLAPQGMLFGQVVATRDTHSFPAGSYGREDLASAVERIEIDGPAGRRTLVPRRDGDPSVLSAFLEGRDDAVGTFFCFLQLPAGEYTLNIRAPGFEDYVARVNVVPGEQPPFKPIVLRVRPGS